MDDQPASHAHDRSAQNLTYEDRSGVRQTGIAAADRCTSEDGKKEDGHAEQQ